jgi:hypothetical protein
VNWEDSRAVTALKRDFLKAFFGRNDAFFLTGGSALGVFYLDHNLYFLDKHGFRVADYFADAKRKEGGLDPAMLSHILSRLRIERIPDYVLEPLSVQDLGAFVDSLRQMFAEMAYPK